MSPMPFALASQSSLFVIFFSILSCLTRRQLR